MTFDQFLQQISSPSLRAVAAHWDEVRGTRLMPSWQDLRPASMAPYLSIVWAFRFDHQTREFTARLAGERITRGFERNFRGLPLKDLHAPQHFPKVYASALRLIEGPSLSLCQGRLFRQHQRLGIGERVCLPLSSDGLVCDGILGASEYNVAPADAGDGVVELLFDGERHVPLDAFNRAVA